MALWKRYGSSRKLRDAIQKNLTGRIGRFTAVGNTRYIPGGILSELQSLGITTIDSSQKHTNAADLVIVTEIMRTLIEVQPVGICLISNDKGFGHCISSVGQMGFPTLVLHDCPTHLASVAKRAVNLSTEGQPPVPVSVALFPSQSAVKHQKHRHRAQERHARDTERLISALQAKGGYTTFNELMCQLGVSTSPELLYRMISRAKDRVVIRGPYVMLFQ